MEEAEAAEHVARQFGKDSTEQLYQQLRDWGIPDYLVYDAPPKAPGKPARQPQSKPAPEQVLKPAAGAAPLFREVLSNLIRATWDLEHREESRQGSLFVAANVRRNNGLMLERNTFSEQDWQRLCEAYGFDPAAARIPDPDPITRTVLGASHAPPEPLTTLIGVYALAGWPMRRLLEAFGRSPEEVNLEDLEKRISGERGLKHTARQVATLFRGGKVGPGKPSGPELDDGEHHLACVITELREQGMSYDEIHENFARFGCTRERVEELGARGMRWPE